MSTEPQLPRAARIFVSFVALMRANNFAVAPEQTTAFLTAIELLGPRDLRDIRQAALATLAPPPERRATFDRLFDLHFRGNEAIEHADDGEDDETVRLQEEGRGDEEPLLSDDANESGLTATRTEALVERRFAQTSTTDALRRLSRDRPYGEGGRVRERIVCRVEEEARERWPQVRRLFVRPMQGAANQAKHGLC